MWEGLKQRSSVRGTFNGVTNQLICKAKHTQLIWGDGGGADGEVYKRRVWVHSQTAGGGLEALIGRQS